MEVPVCVPAMMPPNAALAVIRDDPDIPNETLLEFESTIVPLLAVCVPAASAPTPAPLPRVPFASGKTNVCVPVAVSEEM